MTYDSTIIADSPTVFWTLDDNVSGNGATIADSSGNGLDGTIAVTLGYTSRQASLLSGDPSGFSFAFTGANISTAASVPSPGTGDFAIEAWFSTTDTSLNKSIVAFVGNSNSASLTIFGNSLVFSSGSDGLGGLTTLCDGNPHHVVGARRSGTMHFYVDGSPAGTKADSTDYGATAAGVAWGGDQGPNFDRFVGNLQKVAYYDGTVSDAMVAAHFAAGTSSGPSATVTEQNLPSNHNGNITVHAVGDGTSWSSSTTWTPSGVTGWTVASKTFVDSTHYTIVLTPPGAATPPAGATGTLTLTEGVTGSTAPTTTVHTPTLAVSPTIGTIGTTPTLTLTGTNTLWSGETAAGLFTETGGTGSSIGTPTVSSDIAATDALTVGSAGATLTIKDASTGATASFTASANLASGTASFVSSGPAAIVATCTDAAAGTPSYTYQWRRNTDGGSYSNLSNGGGVSGATTRNLTDGSAATGHLYGYEMVTTDSAGTPASVTSNAVTAGVYAGGPLGTGFRRATFEGGF